MIAVIFAKRSERFPGKHMHMINGKSLIDWVAKKIYDSGLFEKVIIFTKDKEIESSYADIVDDSGEGTLIDSIGDALDLFGEIFAFAGDMPLISVEIIEKMLTKYKGKALCPILPDGHLEPLHAIYNRTIRDEMAQYAKSGRKGVQEFIRSSNFELLQIDDKIPFFNINYPEDVAELINILEEKSS